MQETDGSERDRLVLESMQRLHRQLQIAHAAIVVCAAALRYQNVDRDVEVACVLSRLIADRLSEQIERLTELRAVMLRE